MDIMELKIVQIRTREDMGGDFVFYFCLDFKFSETFVIDTCGVRGVRLIFDDEIEDAFTYEYLVVGHGRTVKKIKVSGVYQSMVNARFTTERLSGVLRGYAFDKILLDYMSGCQSSSEYYEDRDKDEFDAVLDSLILNEEI